MKKRLIFTFTIVVLIFSSMVLSAPTTEDSDLIKEKKPLSGKEILLTEGTSPEGEFKQYSPISEVTTKSGAILKSTYIEYTDNDKENILCMPNIESPTNIIN